MIYYGQDYIPYNKVQSLPAPGDLYIYNYLGDGAVNVWSVSDYSQNIDSVDIDYIDGFWYAFIHASYSQEGIAYSEVDIRNTQTTIHKFFSWNTIVGYTTYKGPIWKDYIYTVPLQVDRLQYLVKYNGNNIYKGWSYEMDGANNIIINEVCQNYLSTVFPYSRATGVWMEDPYAERMFELYIGTDETEEPSIKVAEITFLYDWSYSDYLDYQYDRWLAMEPLQDYYDSRQYELFSVNTLATLTNRAGIEYINLHDSRSVIAVQLPVGSYRLYNYDAQALKVFKFTVQENCGVRYCLYYVNSRGGWDSVLVDGNYLGADKYKRNTYIQNYITPSLNRGVVEYKNNINETWTLNLRNLTDEKNKLFHNLFESTNVFLHDLEEGRILPVIITTTEMQYKTRKNQKRKSYSYQITVESAQRKIRM